MDKSADRVPFDVLWRPPRLIPLWRGILKALTGGQVAFIHTRRDMRAWIAEGKFPVFNRMCPLLNDMGYEVAMMPLYRPPWLRWFNRRSLHIYRGPGRPRRGPGILHVAKGYVEGYWYVDPMGHRENSSISDREYLPRTIQQEDVRQLSIDLRRDHVRPGHSAREQATVGQLDVPEGAIAIMLQRMTPGDEPRTAICSEANMIRAVVAARGERPVVIKYHPFGATDAVRRAVEAVVDPDAGIHLINANIHDILEKAAMICTQTSGSGFEAFIHRKPALLFARPDYHHAGTVVDDLSVLPALIEEAVETKFSYGRYVYWFLEQNLFRPDAVDFQDRVRPVIEAHHWVAEMSSL